MRVALAAMLIMLMLAGCEQKPLQTYRISGTFTQDRAQQDIDALVENGSRHGDVTILESFPEQFVIRHLDEGGCQFLALYLDTQDFIASWRPCEPEPLGT